MPPKSFILRFTEGVDWYVLELVLPENFVPSIKTLCECLAQVILPQKALLYSKIVDFKFSVFDRDLAMGLIV